MRAALLAVAVSVSLVCQADERSDLVDTAWRLVSVTSMNDQVDVPDERDKYTLTLRGDGVASIKADCNRATGSWISHSKSQLQFGVLAATQAICAPGSLSDKYLAQFPWIRSYVFKDKHLFLATMADGAIIEFEPVNDGAVAKVLSERVVTSDYDEARQIILTKLFESYAVAHSISAKPDEIDAYVENMKRGMTRRGLTAEENLTPEELGQVDAMRRRMGEAIIRQWKINRSLHKQYGGRIIYQQLGPEPLDAYRRFLEQSQADGAFIIYDKTLSEKFWRYFEDDAIHDFIPPGSDDAATAFSVPPWRPVNDK